MAEHQRGTDPVGRLVAGTARRLFVSTLGLIAILVIGIGVATAVAGLGALDADVDHALDTTASAELVRLHGELPSADDNPETDEPPSGLSDTFLLDLGREGRVVANPSRVVLSGLPVTAAVTAARTTGRDLRTVELGGITIRLLTVPIGSAGESDGLADGSGGTTIGFVQAGFRLTLHDQESRSLALTVLLVGLVGLAGAAAVTLLITRRALAPIRRALDAQLRFVADASHELRTPAAIIRATAEVLDREGHVAPDGRPFIADIVAESDRLAGLVSDLLTLATTGSGSLVLQRAPVDLAEIAATAARRAESLAVGRAVTISVTGVPGPATVVDGDQDRLVQLVLILLDNAIDHAPSGTTVDVTVDRKGSSVRLLVSDAGPGIPPADLERVFEPFARLDRADRRGPGNAGLGLAIGRRIAEAHDGSISASAGDAGGARFVVSLPTSRTGPDTNRR